MRTLYLIRHAEPNTPEGSSVCLGHTDPHISKIGRMQCSILRTAMNTEPEDAKLTVFSSYLKRSTLTASRVRPNYTVLSGLEELNFGEWDGLTFDEIRERYPEQYERRGKDKSLTPPGGEDRAEGLARFTRAVDMALSKCDGDVAIVSHRAVMSAFIETLENAPSEFEIPYTSVTRIAIDGNRRYLIGDVGQLLAPALTRDMCFLLMIATIPPDDLLHHCSAVQYIADAIADYLEGVGVEIDSQTVSFAAQLHDIAKGRPDHAARGALLLTKLGYPEIGELIAQHHDLTEPWSLEAAVLFIADKLVLGEDEVTLGERFAASRAKCKDEDAINAHEKRFATAKAVAQQINTLCGMDVIDI